MSKPAGKKPFAAVAGAKTARPCDSCIVRRARWYCAADDAFLCQSCDSSVHSANPLARRHERVRLKIASSPVSSEASKGEISPAWHHGFKRKARTPRGAGKGVVNKDETGEGVRTVDTLVPDLELVALEEFTTIEEEEEQLLYRVPILEPVLSELCSPPATTDPEPPVPRDQSTHHTSLFLLPSQFDIPDFEMDMDCLLGRGLDGEDAFSMEDLGLVESYQDHSRVIKEEEEEEESNRESSSVVLGRAVKLDVKLEEKAVMGGERLKRRRIMLDLNLEGVMSAWDNQSSPWIDGFRPKLDLDLDDWSMDFMWGGVAQAALPAAGSGRGANAAVGGGDGGREARVSRYREKRRTRLFSKKIRYEVRKLNAEKRPRMKGRFVKRASLLSSSSGGHGVVGHPQYVF